MSSRLVLLICATLAHVALVSSAKAEVEIYSDSADGYVEHIGGHKAQRRVLGRRHKRVQHHNDPFLHPAPFLKHSEFDTPPQPPRRVRRRIPKGQEQHPPSAPESYVIEVKPGHKPYKKRVHMNHHDLYRHHMKRRRRQLRKFRRELRKKQKSGKHSGSHHFELPAVHKRGFHAHGSQWRHSVYDNDYDINDAGDEEEDE